MFAYRYFHPAQRNGIIGYKKLLSSETNVNSVGFCMFMVCCFFFEFVGAGLFVLHYGNGFHLKTPYIRQSHRLTNIFFG